MTEWLQNQFKLLSFHCFKKLLFCRNRIFSLLLSLLRILNSQFCDAPIRMEIDNLWVCHLLFIVGIYCDDIFQWCEFSYEVPLWPRLAEFFCEATWWLNLKNSYAWSIIFDDDFCIDLECVFCLRLLKVYRKFSLIFEWLQK